MSQSDSSLPPPSPEQRRVAAGQFEHANQVIASRKNYQYGIHLLLSCCKLDPANLIYRQALRRTQKARYRNNLRGSWLAWLTSWRMKAKMKAAAQAAEHLQVLDFGEQVLCGNPWDIGAQLEMARAADTLGLLDMAIWVLEQARQKAAQNPKVNRELALLYEERGNFTQASNLWEMVRRADPHDSDAPRKLTDLAARETLVRGRYTLSALKDGDAGRPVDEVAENSQEPRGAAAELDAAAGVDVAALLARVENEPTIPEVWLALAAHYRKHDDLERAHAILRTALGATGHAFAVTVELANLEIEPFRRNLAVTEKKLKSAPSDENLKKLRLQLRKEINTRELELFRRRAERFPGELAHRLELGIRLLRAGLASEALGELQAAREDPRHLAQAAYYLGLAFKSDNNWTEAQRCFDEALGHLRPSDRELKKEVLYQLARGAAQAGNLTRAIELGRELAYEDYSYHDIGRLVGEWRARLHAAG